MDTQTQTEETALSTLAFLSALQAKPHRNRLAGYLFGQGRWEVRYLDVVLIEAPDAGPVKRIEFYRVDPADGIEMFQGYLNERTCPQRVEMLRLWIEAMSAPLPVQSLTVGQRAALDLEVNRIKWTGGELLRQAA